jgi:restriction endonuclease S subunit
MKPRVPNWKEVTSVPPNEWNRVFLGDVFAHRQERGQINLPLLSVTAKNGVVRQDTLNRRDTSNDDKSRYFRIFPGDIVYNTMRMWQGVSALTNDEGIVSPAYTICTPKDGILSKYAKYLFKFQPLINVFRGYSQGLVNDTLNLKFESFSQIEIILPPIQEQKKIAAILCSVDDGIQATQAVIDQTRRVKQGLMQQLLTRGIGHTRFKQTEIGEIPEEWCIKTAKEVCSKISVGIVVKPTQYYESNGIKCFRSANVREGYIEDHNWVYISEEANNLNAKSKLHSGDVLIVRTGYPGTSCVVPQEYDGTNCIDIIFARPKVELILSHYLSCFINSSLGKKQVLYGQGGLAQKHFNVNALNQMKIVLPSIDEQKKITTILTNMDNVLNIELDKMVQIQKTKCGLMQDLLTGRVRVKLDGEATT